MLNPVTMYNEIINFRKEAEIISENSLELKEAIDLSYGLINHILNKTEIFSKLNENEKMLLKNLEKQIQKQVIKKDSIYMAIHPLIERLKKKQNNGGEKGEKNEKN